LPAVTAGAGDLSAARGRLLSTWPDGCGRSRARRWNPSATR